MLRFIPDNRDTGRLMEVRCPTQELVFLPLCIGRLVRSVDLVFFSYAVSALAKHNRIHTNVTKKKREEFKMRPLFFGTFYAGKKEILRRHFFQIDISFALYTRAAATCTMRTFLWNSAVFVSVFSPRYGPYQYCVTFFYSSLHCRQRKPTSREFHCNSLDTVRNNSFKWF